MGGKVLCIEWLKICIVKSAKLLSSHIFWGFSQRFCKYIVLNRFTLIRLILTRPILGFGFESGISVNLTYFVTSRGRRRPNCNLKFISSHFLLIWSDLISSDLISSHTFLLIIIFLMSSRLMSSIYLSISFYLILSRLTFTILRSEQKWSLVNIN